MDGWVFPRSHLKRPKAIAVGDLPSPPLEEHYVRNRYWLKMIHVSAGTL